MNLKQAERIFRRDQGACYHCGITGDVLTVHHRLNRGAGGKNSKADKVSNHLTICSLFNGLMESDPEAAAQARLYGWKLSQWQAPDFVGVYEAHTGLWWILEDDGSRHEMLSPYETD